MGKEKKCRLHHVLNAVDMGIVLACLRAMIFSVVLTSILLFVKIVVIPKQLLAMAHAGGVRIAAVSFAAKNMQFP